jgi:hypothetical protein
VTARQRKVRDPSRLRARWSRLAVAGAALVVAGLLVSGCVSSQVSTLPDPPKVKVKPTITTVPDLSGISIPPVDGTTSTVPVAMKGGTAALSGVVTAGGQPLPGSVVHIDRFLGERSVGVDLTTGADGRYGIDGLQGGRYRVRAFHAPDATMPAPQIFFLNGGDKHTLDLQLDRYSSDAVFGANIAPSPPLLGQTANLVVALTTKSVDTGGVARSSGKSGVVVQLLSAGGRAILTPNPVVTDGSGKAQWTLRCDSLDDQGLTAVFPDGSQRQVNVAPCELPPTTTTTLATPPPPPTP